jgi:hypothetical protein
MKGDQVRAFQLVELLHPEHEVTVLTPGTPTQPDAFSALAAMANVVTIPVSLARRALGAAEAALRGAPLEVGWMTPSPVAMAAQRLAADHDVVLACTIRSLAGPLPIPVVLDHVDALSANMRLRSRLERRRAVRLAARLEARLLARRERAAARWVVAQMAVSPIDAASLPPSPAPVVLPLAYPGLPDTSYGAGDRAERDIDVILTGNMRYPPNRDAADWLTSEIVPELRCRRADARIVVAGRGAAGTVVADGVEVLSDVPDVEALLRRARVAVAPLRGGTGMPIKALEAVTAGAAVVSTPWVARALELDLETATDASAFAAKIDRLLADEPFRCQRVKAALDGLAAFDPASVRMTLERTLMNAVNVAGN